MKKKFKIDFSLQKEKLANLENPENVLGGSEDGSATTTATNSGCTWITLTPAGTLISLWVDCTLFSGQGSCPAKND